MLYICYHYFNRGMICNSTTQFVTQLLFLTLHCYNPVDNGNDNNPDYITQLSLPSVQEESYSVRLDHEELLVSVTRLKTSSKTNSILQSACSSFLKEPGPKINSISEKNLSMSHNNIWQSLSFPCSLRALSFVLPMLVVEWPRWAGVKSLWNREAYQEDLAKEPTKAQGQVSAGPLSEQSAGLNAERPEGALLKRKAEMEVKWSCAVHLVYLFNVCAFIPLTLTALTIWERSFQPVRFTPTDFFFPLTHDHWKWINQSK